MANKKIEVKNLNLIQDTKSGLLMRIASASIYGKKHFTGDLRVIFGPENKIFAVFSGITLVTEERNSHQICIDKGIYKEIPTNYTNVTSDGYYIYVKLDLNDVKIELFEN